MYSFKNWFWKRLFQLTLDPKKLQPKLVWQLPLIFWSCVEAPHRSWIALTGISFSKFFNRLANLAFMVMTTYQSICWLVWKVKLCQFLSNLDDVLYHFGISIISILGLTEHDDMPEQSNSHWYNNISSKKDQLKCKFSLLPLFECKSLFVEM